VTGDFKAKIGSITIFGPAAVTKRVQLMHELIPKAATIAYLMNPKNPNAEFELGAAQEAAQSGFSCTPRQQ
jgi:putative tryptophan/tyrosine transport system substrate-binding protein